MVANGPVAVLTSAAHRDGPASTRRTDEAGSAALEFVILTPVLTLLVLFLLWAGGTGHARLAADLAAEEAATAAALCCDSDDDERREFVVEAILSGKTELSRLCVTEPRPLGDRYVSQSTFPFRTADGIPSGGVGVLAVGFGCETDGGVGGPGTIFPSSEIRGRATEVLLLPPGDSLRLDNRPILRVADATADERFKALTFVLELNWPAAPDREISVFYRLLPYDDTDPDSIANAKWALTSDNPFDFCNGTIADIVNGGGNYDPADFAASHRDHLKTTGYVRIPRGETTATISVPIFDDCLHEENEYLVLELYNENEANVRVERRQAVGTILSDDAEPFVTFLHTAAPVDVGEQPQDPADTSQYLPLELTLRNSLDPFFRTIGVLPVTGNIITVDGTASAAGRGLCPADYTAIATGDAESAFPNPQMESGNAVRVEILDDGIHEGRELFEVKLESATGALVEIHRFVTVAIVDNDPLPTLALFDSNGQMTTNLLVREDEGPLQLDVRLVNAAGNEIGSGLPVTFTYEAIDRSAAINEDYDEDIPGSGWTIRPCTRGSALTPGPTVAILDDPTVEGDEKFELDLKSVHLNAVNSARITVTIEDDD